MLNEAAGWIAPAATMIAAMMTAANLGPRVTGWGFVVFVIGSVAWIMVALASGQTNLLLTNLVLTAVNLVGVWRWLGRIARFAKGGERAHERSGEGDDPTLFPLSRLQGVRVLDGDGREIGRAVDAMLECGEGRIGYLVVAAGGIGGVGERLHALAWQEGRMGDDAFRTDLSTEAMAARPVLPATEWPATREAAGVA